MCRPPLGHQSSAAPHHRCYLCVGQEKLMPAGRASWTAGSSLSYTTAHPGGTGQRVPGICSPLDALTCHLGAGWRPHSSEPHSRERAEGAALSLQCGDGAPCPGLSLVLNAGSALQGELVRALRSPPAKPPLLNSTPTKIGEHRKSHLPTESKYTCCWGSQSRGKHPTMSGLHPGTWHLAPNCSVRTSPWK